MTPDKSVFISRSFENHPHFAWVQIHPNFTFADFAQEIPKLKASKQKSLFFVSETDLAANSEAAEGHSLYLALIYTDSRSEAQLNWLSKFSSLNHLIPMVSKELEQEVKHLGEYFVKWADGSFQGKHPKAEGVPGLKDTNQKTLSQTNDRWQAYEDIAKYVSQLQCFPDFTQITQTVASELLTNAFYDAKRHHPTGQEFHGDRTSEFSVDPDHVQFFYGRDDEHLWLTVKDPFGSLSRTTLIKAMCRAANERTPIIHGVGGAGLGLIIVYEFCSAVYFVLSEGNFTSVSCKLKLSKRSRDFSMELPSLHIFIEEKA